MCITSLQSELLRLIEDKKETPVDERGKTHTFPDDLYLAGDNAFQEQFQRLSDDLITIPKPPQKTYQEAYKALYEQILLNLARCVITRQWLCIAGSNQRRADGSWKYAPHRCHIYKSEKLTQTVLGLLEHGNLIIKDQGAAYEKGTVENHYFPTKHLAVLLAPFSPFVEEEIKPSSKYLKINNPEAGYEDFKWHSDHQDLIDILTINEFAKNQSWTLKAPIRRTFNMNPFMVGRLLTPFQNLPSRDYNIRANTLINGNKIAEVDFNANHLRLFLAFNGQPYTGDDPYMELVDMADVSRNEVKGFITVAMNCENFTEAQGAALSEHAVSNQVSSLIYAAFKKRFKGISLFKKITNRVDKPFGVFAMNFEGVILKNVMLEAIKQNIFTLPIHDAVACEAQHAETIKHIMNIEWCKEVSKFDGISKISTKTKITLVQ
jgi:hypothetical protein